MSEMPERQSPVPDPKRSGGMLTPAAVPEPTLEGKIAEVLARHAVTFPRGYANECCTCGWESDLGQHPESQGAAHLAAVLAPLVVEVRERAVKAWNIEVARLAKVRALVEVMERDYSHAEAGHVRMAAGRLLNALDTPVEELRASLPFSAAGGRP